MPKGNTLFSYFSKASTPQSKGKNQENGSDSDVLCSANNQNKCGSSPKPLIKPLNIKPTDPNPSCPFALFDLVWARLEGYPWWPSMVCNHPKTDKYRKQERKVTYIHVQFFDDPPSRGWVKEKFVKTFTGSDSKDFERGGQFFSANPTCRKGAEEADRATKMSSEERRGLLVALESSSEDEDEEDMDVDENMGESSIDSSKENAESPKKTPAKLTRSAVKPKAKRRRIMIASDSDGDADSADEFKPKGSGDEDGEESDEGSSGVDEDDVSDTDTPSDPETPVKKRKRESSSQKVSKKSTSSIGSFFTPGDKGKSSSYKASTPSSSNKASTPSSISNKTKSKLSLFSAPESSPAPGGSSEEGRTFPHLSLDILQPDKIRDAEKHLKSSPDYNPRTLYLPESFLNKQTPAMRQWWDMKAKYFDTILFFKMGKFYELFHMDAVIGVNELGLIYMKGEHAHSGFPEIAFGRYAESLIQKGYKVARIEQTETPDMANERCKQMSRSTKYDKVVRREICSVQTKGTKRYSFIDGDAADTSNVYLLALCEKLECDTGSGKTYGVCFIDTSIGKFHLGQFEDDRHSSRLRTLISHYPPSQVLTERGKLSDKTSSLLTNNLSSVIRETLKPGTEFWDSSKTLKTLSESTYFQKDVHGQSTMQWPDALKQMIAEGDALGHTAADGFDMALSSLGGLIWYLQTCLMDEELVSMGDMELYIPLDIEKQQSSSSEMSSDQLPSFLTGRQKMVLDGVTLANLDVLVNSSTGTGEGTLLDRMDNCATAFGKRLFKQWLCAPLCNPAAIDDRLDAVEDLMVIPDVTAEVIEMLKKIPDLERLLSKIHTLGSAHRSQNHPDGRAIFFEDVTYSKRKIEDFLSALEGFKMAIKLIAKFQSKLSDFKSKVLRQTVTVDGADKNGRFPDLSKELAFFEKAFDHQKAKAEGVIKPSSGVDEDYDQAMDDVRSINRGLQDYLQEQKKRIGCQNMVFWGTGKNRFQMEVPEGRVRHIPDDYELASSKKGYKRYKTPEIEDKLAEMVDAEERRDAALKDIMRRIFATFDKSYSAWSAAVQCLSVLDVLINLAQYSRCGDGAMCRPQFVLPSAHNQPCLEIREGRHPCICRTYGGGDFIPNDVVIGIKDDQDMDGDEASDLHAHSRVVLVTGPNMGGKSTLMRQVGIITIMAQLGCYVPAEKCSLTPVDRVFTRLGASDRIMAGESTFFVELSETSSILQHATEHSLVLLDELGRGTATYDGTAIAYAVVNELSQNIHCRTLFSTHYHSLVEEFSHDPNVRLGHMACMVENENEEDPTQETITFLYKFVKGSCPKSYGFNAARLANIPDEVITVAHKKAKEFQAACDQIRQFRSLCTDKGQLEQLLIQVRS